MKNAYEIRGDVTAIIINSPKHGNFEALISTSILCKMDEIRGSWMVSRDRSGNFYAVTTVFGKNYRKTGDVRTVGLHRFVTGAVDGDFVDHMNHNTLDNTLSNLRVCDRSENAQNRKGPSAKSTSGVRGVSWDKVRRKWKASASVRGKYLYGGYHTTLEEAEEAAKRIIAEHLPFSNMT